MDRAKLPAVLPILADEPGPAVDAALAAALPHMDPSARASALDVICQRNHGPSIATLVGQYTELDPAIREMLHERIAHLYGACRIAIESPDPQARLSTIELIRATQNCDLAYLLAAAIKRNCPRTREAAAYALQLMTERWLNEHPDHAPQHATNDVPYDDAQDFMKAQELMASDANSAAEGTPPESGKPPHEPDPHEVAGTRLGQALGDAVRSWDIHHQPRALRAAMWLSEYCIPLIREKLEDGHSRVAQQLNSIINAADDPQLVPFVFQSLTIPALQHSAAHAIALAQNREFVHGIIEQCSVLDDEMIRRACRRIPNLAWLVGYRDSLEDLDDLVIVNLVRLIASIGGSPSTRIELYRILLTLARPKVGIAIVDRLRVESSMEATAQLELMTLRRDDPVGEKARQALQERTGNAPKAFPSMGSTPQAGESQHAHAESGQAMLAPPPANAALEEFEEAFARCQKLMESTSDESKWTESLHAVCRMTHWPVRIRSMLARNEPTQRTIALRMVRASNQAHLFEEQIFRLAYDRDAMVRATSVAILEALPGPAAKRILRAAANDPDDRVQANAIDVLDAWDDPDRREIVAEKLDSQNARVRAAAARTLLRMEMESAGEVLLDMLEDNSRSQRISALWVVERLKLRSLLQRLAYMSTHDEDRQVRARAQSIMMELGVSRVEVAQHIADTAKSGG